MNPEVLLAGGYVLVLLASSFILEWLSAHTHVRSQRFRTAGFDYDPQQDLWVCHQGEQLWPREFDRERRLVRYRAKATACNSCPVKDGCTDSDEGREITRAFDSWPHSEAGRFHRGIAVFLVGLGVMILVVVGIRHHELPELAVLMPLTAVSLLAGWWLAKDLLAHPVDFPEPKPAHGLRFTRSDVARSTFKRSSGPGR
ncbi:MAG: hypothetical protein JJE13_12965 [Thermoleophilia bacterium]|nr:hypothetical protein [Thermoleophilia bacterium]